ncbi:YjbQ family protein [Candidatus Woesearchaeota archaeon]|nr:YjbQ family protein [Candidatus Woesearchaeota archaeon]
MKAHTAYLKFHTDKRIEFVNITKEVERVVQESGVTDGLCLVNPMHITAAIYVNDAESGIIEDYKELLEKLAPYKHEYHHHQTGEDNGAAHLWRQLMGHQVTVPITDGKIDFGTWEQIFYAEFDGQRTKRVLVKVIGK